MILAMVRVSSKLRRLLSVFPLLIHCRTCSAFQKKSVKMISTVITQTNLMSKVGTIEKVELVF